MKHTLVSARRLASSLLVLAALGTSCVGDLDWSLSVAGDPDDPTARELRARLDIRILPGGTAPLPAGCTVATGTCTPETFAAAVYGGCGAPQGWAAGACGSPAVNASRQICVAEALLRVADAVEPENLLITTKDYVIVPPQDTESQAELARLARIHAATALQYALDGLLDPACNSALLRSFAALDPANPGTLGALTQGENLAGFVREAHHLVEESSERMLRASLAVSDAQRARATDRAEAERLELAAFASRAAAAHMLVGGSHGLGALQYVSQTGFFGRPRLGAEGRVALGLLRTAAVSPALLADDTLELERIIEGLDSSDEAQQNSVRGRLAVMLPDDTLFTATTSQALARLGVSRDAFVEAREYLVTERRAFDRSPSWLAPAEIMPSGELSSEIHRPLGVIWAFKLYAATRTEPQQPPAIWWSALLRFDDSRGTPLTVGRATVGPAWDWFETDASGSVPHGFTFGTETQTGTATITVTGEPTLAAHREATASRAETAAVRLQGMIDVVGSGTKLDDARDTIASTLADIGRGSFTNEASASPTGRARACVLGESWDSVALRVDLQIPSLDTSRLIVVSSHESLDCAVRGTVEGVPCGGGDIETVGGASPWATSSIATDAVVTQWSVPLSGQWDAIDRPNVEVYTFFVLRRRDGFGALEPGGYEPVTGWAFPRPEDPDKNFYTYCDYTPVIPGLDAEARDALAPDTAFAGDQLVSCSGVRAGMLLPLENELTDDMNGIESSWRHYLALAQQAADEADMLGETLVDEGLEMDLRAEGAIDELQRICGVAINVSPTQAIPPTAAPISPGVCPAGYFVHDATATLCQLDPLAYAAAGADTAAANALTACLGELGENADYTGLGDHALCMWRVGGAVCQGSGDSLPCPFVLADPADGSLPTCPPLGTEAYPALATEAVAVTRHLDLFHTPQEQIVTRPSPDQLPCAALSRVRAGATTGTWLQDYVALLGAPFMTQQQFAAAAGRLRWEATAGDFSGVRVGSSSVFSTGRPEGSLGLWPQVSARTDLCPAGSPAFAPTSASSAITMLASYTGPLFCIPGLGGLPGTDDERRILRAMLNDMMARAVIAAHVISGAPLDGTRVPYYPDLAGDIVRFDDADFVRRGTSSPAFFESGVGSFAYDFSVSYPDTTATAFHDLGSMHVAAVQRIGAPTDGSHGTIGGAEWNLCPYEGGPCKRFQTDSGIATRALGEDGSPSQDDGPFYARTFTSDVVVPNSDERITQLWGEDGRTRLRSWVWRTLTEAPRGAVVVQSSRVVLPGSRGDIPLSSLSNYFARDDVGFGSLVAPNRAQIEAPGGGLTPQDFLNGLELTCAASGSQLADPIAGGCDVPLEIQSARDLLGASDYLECVANRTSDAGARSVIRGLPPGVADRLRQGGAEAYGQASGEYGAEVATIRAALNDMRDEEAGMADDIRRFAAALRLAQNTVRASQLSDEIQGLQLEGELAGQITACVTSLADIVTHTTDGFGAGAIGTSIAAGATCANSVFQSLIAAQTSVLRGEIGGLEIENAYLDADRQFVETSASMRRHAISVSSSLARIDGALTSLRTLQAQGRTALARALFLDASSTGVHMSVDTVMHRRYDTTLTRYREAHERAVRLAYIARIALEQRLAVNLSDMTDDLVSVDAPSGWADELCTLTPIDYETIRNTGDPTLPSPDNYAGLFLGDYVRRLEQVFESYSFAYPFRDGTDTVVLSLRDDVFGVRRTCATEVPNLLYNASSLEAQTSESRIGWDRVGCTSPVPGVEDTGCVTVYGVEGSSPVPFGETSSGSPVPMRVAFGIHATATTRLSQSVALDPGRYRLSWWARAAAVSPPASTIEPDAAVRALGASGSALAVLNTGGPTGPATAPPPGEWGRYDYFFDVSTADPIEVAVLPGSSPDGRAIDLAGLQLVAAGALFDGSVERTLTDSPVPVARRFGPGPFYDTTDSRVQMLPNCPDDGTEFRRQAFSYGCSRVCADGFDGTCDPSAATERCYWQTSFNASSDSLQRVLTGHPAGFAAGNFNYRFESIGVNMVGTGLRDCRLSGTGSCYSSGNLSISILHQGDLLVRNTFGGTYLAPLFPGRIESARALAAERYLTNPLSSADGALIEPYARAEFQGRPLAGTVLLRVWDEDGLVFRNLEDVQIMVRYRYWQHQR